MNKQLVLLGAGASVEAGVPVTNELTKQLVLKCSESAEYRDSLRAIRFVLGGLMFKAAKDGRDPYAGINAEDLFNAIELLAGRHNIEVSPFISAWAPEIDAIEHANDEEQAINVNRFLDSFCADMLEGGKTYRLPKTAPSTAQFIDSVKAVAGLTLTNVFERANFALLKLLADIIWKDKTTPVDYLAPLVEAARKSQIPIATLNYDNCIELCAARRQIDVHTGITGWATDGEAFDSTSGDGVTLIKIHGSINWAMEPRQPSADRPAPGVVITPWEFTDRPSDDDFYKRPSVRPGVIFGGRNKLTALGPFLDLFRRFQANLSWCNHLVTIGYSFNDPHVNAVIAHWLNYDQSRKISVIAGEHYSIESSSFWSEAHEPFLNERIKNLRMRAGEGIRRLFGEGQPDTGIETKSC